MPLNVVSIAFITRVELFPSIDPTFLLDVMPNYRHSTCPYCPKTFRNAGPFDNHLRSSHPDQTGFLYNRRGSFQKSPQNFPESEQSYLESNDLSYSSSPEDLWEDFSSDSDAESEFDNSSDELEEGLETATRSELYKDSVKTYRKVAGDEESDRNFLENPWSPFRNATEFKLARFFVNANVSWENVETFMKASLAPPEVHFTSSFTLRKLLNSMGNSLGPETWKVADVTLSGLNVPFFYRNPLACIEYLIR